MGPKISVASRRVVTRVVLRVVAGKGKACRLGRRAMLARARARVAFLIYQVSWRFLLSGPVTPSRVDRDCAIHASLPLSLAGSRSQDQRSWDREALLPHG